MKVRFDVKMLRVIAIEMTSMRKIGDFPHAFGKVIRTFPHSNSVFTTKYI